MGLGAPAAAKSRHGVYYYHFTQAPPFPANSIYRNWGASHFAELWYMSGHLDQEKWAWTEADRNLADAMTGYWVNFTRTGNPNGGGLTEWPAFTPAGQRVQYLGDAITSGDVPNLAPLQVFDRVYDGVRGAAFGLPSPP